jgi:predicted RNA-binding protein with TRAM domain
LLRLFHERVFVAAIGDHGEGTAEVNDLGYI